tara:strand:+ start:12845 stop:13207 length:363 start_codon:yes stop_codon:yes gene_type:complete
MTFSFMTAKPENPLLPRQLLLKYNSKTQEDVTLDVVLLAIKKCADIFVTCSDDSDSVMDAKARLVKLAQLGQFEQDVPSEMVAKFENTKQFAVSLKAFIVPDDGGSKLDDMLAKAFEQMT